VLGRIVAAEQEVAAEDLVEELLALLMAAQEPMAAALTWVLLRIASEPTAAELWTREDADAGLAAAVVAETLRLHPPAFGVLRRLVAPVEIGGHTLPEGTVTVVPIPVVQRDARYHQDPDAFRPERHVDPTSPVPQQAMLPFGGGARRCLGEPLAWTEIDAVVPTVLRALTLQPIGPQPEKMVLRGTILVPRRSGLVVARR
jgi:cytochrome P450